MHHVPPPWLKEITIGKDFNPTTFCHFIISDVPEYDDIFKDSDDEMEDGDENDSAQANGLGEIETDDDLDSNPMSKRKR